MIIAHEYPVCEYDTARDPIIHPTDFLDKCLPKKCIITFFRKELEKFAGEHKLPVIGQLHSEVLDIPIYKYESGENPLCITMPFSTAPGAAGTIEELHAMGCETFVVCGAAGALTQGSTLGEIILPASAIRDEGTSFHYIAPSREISCHKEAPGYQAAPSGKGAGRTRRCPRWECRLCSEKHGRRMPCTAKHPK